MVIMEEWLSRWRAASGLSPGGPSDEMFGLLLELTPEEAAIAAEDANVDRERLMWWREVAADETRHHLARLRPSQYAVMRSIRGAGPLTDQEIADRLGKSIRMVVPRRSELMRAGLVVSAGRKTTGSGRSANVWGTVALDEIEQAKQAAAKKGLRKKKLTDYSVEDQVRMVQVLVRIPTVNEALLGDMSTSAQAKRARREARNAQKEYEQRRREWAEKVRQAERDASPELNFLKAMGQLRRGTDAVREIGKVFQTDLDALEFDGHAFISPDNWREARTQVEELLELAQLLDHAIGVAIGDVEDDVIEVEALDDDWGELLEG
jgi:hypothetical protein